MFHLSQNTIGLTIILIKVSTCFEHRAISEKNQAKKGFDSTGLVAIACARHGCFAPGSVVDMQKGERCS